LTAKDAKERQGEIAIRERRERSRIEPDFSLAMIGAIRGSILSCGFLRVP
jgi:hypothetical protein